MALAATALRQQGANNACATIQPSMHLTHLSLTNFRNFARLESAFPAGLTLLIGANAQGKTSLLEAIYYLTGAGSAHTTSDRELINFLALQSASPFARIVGEVRRGDRLQRIEIRLLLEASSPGADRRLRKEVLLNGVKRRVSELAAVFNAVLFLPQDTRIVDGSPAHRRRHLDAIISQADAAYAEALSAYGKVLSQRNALLKLLQERPSSGDEELAFWNERLSEQAATLIRARALALDELEQLAAPIHHDLTRRKEALRLEYQPAYDPLPQPQGQLGLPLDVPLDRTGIGHAEIRDGLLRALERSRRDEIAQGMTLTGPQRDDFRFLSNGIDLHPYGSRGQNRTAMLALKLAEVEWLRRRSGEDPVLLLDEVLAELDTVRRRDLLERVGDMQQVILTSADLALFHAGFREQATIWQISGGKLAPLADEGSSTAA